MTQIKITELDFFEIKQNLTNFLKQQDEFKDYDFDGSAIQVLLDILSSNTYYNSMYQNMVSNESFLDSSILRESVVSNSKVLGYTPRSQKSAQARITLFLKENVQNNGTAVQPSHVTLPSHSNFISSNDGSNYIFTNLESQILNNTQNYVDNQGVTRKLYSSTFDIFQGIKNNQVFLVDYKNNPDQRFIIENNKIDLNTLVVKVKESNDSEEFVYTKSENVSRVASGDRVYWVIENEKGNYELQFGNDRIGRKLIDSAQVNLEYLITEGSVCNKFKLFNWNDVLTIEDPIDSSNNASYSLYEIELVSESFGGDEKETIEEIKFAAPKYYESQNRAVTSSDYRFLIENKYKSVDSVKTWGGEDNDPQEFGKVFISLKPKEGYFITDYAKDGIKNDIIKKYNVVTIQSEIVDPYFTYICLDSTVKYNLNEISYGENFVKDLILENLRVFNDQNLGKFDSYFRFSNLVNIIDTSHTSIKSNNTNIVIKNKIEISADEDHTYSSNFNNTLVRGSMVTNSFNYSGKSDCFMEDSDGKISIYHTENEIKKLLKKDVGTVDYIKGKLNIPSLLIESGNNLTLDISFKTLDNDLVPYNNQIFILELGDVELDMVNISNQF
tara:strand:+ start:6087 stop:7922 length:1836 start_codon:yes stop_codon:yes gene_type:complete